jgi:hypothetical protein
MCCRQDVLTGLHQRMKLVGELIHFCIEIVVDQQTAGREKLNAADDRGDLISQRWFPRK